MRLPPGIKDAVVQRNARAYLSRLMQVALVAFAAGVFLGILLERHEHPVPVVEHRVGAAHP